MAVSLRLNTVGHSDLISCHFTVILLDIYALNSFAIYYNEIFPIMKIINRCTIIDIYAGN